MKIVSLILAIVMLLPILAGCSITLPDDTGTDKSLAILQNRIKKDGKAFAIAYLGGYTGYEELRAALPDSVYTKLYPFIDDIPEDRFVSSGAGWDTYVVIPADADAEITVHMWVYDEDMTNPHKGEVLYSDGGAPIIIKCNVSDLFEDMLVTVTVNGTEYEWKPYLSLKDGTVNLTDDERGFILDLTEYK